MSSTVAEPRALLLGDQRPRLWSGPAPSLSEGARVAGLAEAAGLHLDDWERWVLEQGLGRDEAGQWSAFEVALIVARQNGKGAILEALELAALFLDDFGVELILHSAHEFKTAAEAFRRIEGRIEQAPSLRRRVRQVYRQRGAESVELRNGKRLRFIARTGGSGRGFTADLVILDEAYSLGDEEMAALLPTLSSRPNPQIWYTSTAGNPQSSQLGAVRRRGMKGDDPSLAFFEWSAEEGCDPSDPRCWALANPGMGIRISPDYIEKERAALPATEFARERLSIGDYPVDDDQRNVLAGWGLRADPASRVLDPVAVGFAVAPDQSSAAIAVGGRRADGLGHGELVEFRPGTGWLVARLLEIVDEHDVCALVMNAVGAARAFEKELAGHGFAVKPEPGQRLLVKLGMAEYAAACGALTADVVNDRWRHMGQAPLDDAAAGVRTRPLADAWAWSWRLSAADIGPLEAVTNARYGFAAHGAAASFFGSWR